MEQRSLRLLSYNPRYNPEQTVDFNNLVFLINDISDLNSEIDALERLVSNIPTTPVGVFLIAANNLSDVANTNTSLNNLLPSQATHAGEFLQTDGTNTSWVAMGGGGTVTVVTGTNANGISWTITNPNTTPDLTIALGAITPTTVNGITLSGSGSIANSGVTALTGFTGSGTSSGTNTGDQTIAGLSPLTTKGDIFVYSTVNTRLPVGATDGMILGVSAAAATGLVWSTPTYPMARGSAGVILRSDGTNNVYSTSTFADTYTASNLLYSNGANTVTGLATANSGVLVTNGSGVPSIGTDIPTAVTIGTAYIYRAGGTDVGVADGGTGASTEAAARANLNVFNDNLDLYAALGSAIVAQNYTPLLVSASGAMTSQTVMFQAIWLPKAVTLNGVWWYQRTAGSYTANNYNGVGLYTYSGGTMTLVASSTTDGNIWKATSQTWSSKAFSGTYGAAAGLYFIAALYCSSAQATAPALGVTAGTLTNVLSMDFTNSAKLSSTLAGQTALPSPQASSGTTISSTQPYFGLY